METSKSIFMNSYLKKMKRPEFGGDFNPNSNYGANMTHGSEKTNPWAGRNQSNAKYGALGGSSGYLGQPFSLSPGSTSGGIGGSQFNLGDILAHGEAGINLPFLPSKEKETFNKLSAPIVTTGSKVASEAITDWMKSPSSSEKLSPMMEGFVEKVLKDTPSTDVGNVFSDMGGAYGKMADVLVKPSSDALSSAIGAGEGAFEGATTSGTAALGSSIPYVGAGLNVLKDVMSGQVFKNPFTTLGSTGGMLGGAALGSMLFPGVGTVLGGALGGGLGRMLGGIGRLFR